MTPATGSWSDALARLGAGPQTRDAGTPALSRPASLEYLGCTVAERIGPGSVDMVATWDNVDDAALGHVVARELGVDHALVYEPREGQLGFDCAPAHGDRVAVVGVAFDRMNSVRAPLALVASCGAEVACLAALTPSPVIETELDDRAALLTLTPH